MNDMLTSDELAKSTQLAADLHRLADLIQDHPELGCQLQFDLVTGGLYIWPESADVRAEVARFIRTMRAESREPVRISTFEDRRTYIAHIGTIRVNFYVRREAVCTRVVVGTREITEEVPDPEALAAVPKVIQTRIEDVVEWQCNSVLAGDTDTIAEQATDSPSTSSADAEAS